MTETIQKEQPVVNNDKKSKRKKKLKISSENIHLNIYIKNILKTIDPNITIQSKAIEYINQLIEYFVKIIATNINLLMKNKSKETVSYEDIMHAVQLNFPKHVCDDINELASKAKKSYETNKEGLKEARANLIIPVTRIDKAFRELVVLDRVSETSPIYLASTIEYLTSHILDIASNETTSLNKKQLNIQHINSGIIKNDEYKFIMRNVFLTPTYIPLTIVSLA